MSRDCLDAHWALMHAGTEGDRARYVLLPQPATTSKETKQGQSKVDVADAKRRAEQAAAQRNAQQKDGERPCANS